MISIIHKVSCDWTGSEGVSTHDSSLSMDARLSACALWRRFFIWIQREFFIRQCQSHSQSSFYEHYIPKGTQQSLLTIKSVFLQSNKFSTLCK